MAKKFMQQDMKDKLSLLEIKEIITMIRRNGILEFDLEQGGMRLRIVTSKDNSENVSAPPVVIHSMNPPVYSNPTIPRAPIPAYEIPKGESISIAEKEKNKVEKTEEITSNLKEIKSPMVGTFYRAPAPDAPPYVELGDFIKEDTVLCIVEAMKLMNEIKAEMRGTIKKILVESGHPVEYGQALFLIDAASA